MPTYRCSIGQVVLPHADPVPIPDVGVDARPSDEQIRALMDALPAQPVHVAVALAGARERPGWWGPGRPASWRTPCRPRGCGRGGRR